MEVSQEAIEAAEEYLLRIGGLIVDGGEVQVALNALFTALGDRQTDFVRPAKLRDIEIKIQGLEKAIARLSKGR